MTQCMVLLLALTIRSFADPRATLWDQAKPALERVRPWGGSVKNERELVEQGQKIKISQNGLQMDSSDSSLPALQKNKDAADAESEYRNWMSVVKAAAAGLDFTTAMSKSNPGDVTKVNGKLQFKPTARIGITSNYVDQWMRVCLRLKEIRVRTDDQQIFSKQAILAIVEKERDINAKEQFGILNADTLGEYNFLWSRSPGMVKRHRAELLNSINKLTQQLQDAATEKRQLMRQAKRANRSKKQLAEIEAKYKNFNKIIRKRRNDMSAAFENQYKKG